LPAIGDAAGGAGAIAVDGGVFVVADEQAEAKTMIAIERENLI
jgi:hypothetical protein